MSDQQEEWFGKWFDSPYYHILYKHRDYKEAQHFLDKIIAFLKPEQDAKILDVACGKGRHSIYLNSLGFDVTGVDLSESNVQYANTFSNETLRFFRHDMREVFQVETFDCVCNLFTSFGYFDRDSENLSAIQAMADNLKFGGTLVLDFLNPYTVINKLVEDEEKIIDGIVFKITRRFTKDGYIVKQIDFSDKGQVFSFQEKVKAIRRIEFLDYFRQSGLRLQHIFGNYELEEYVAEKSERMIFICEK